MTATAAPPDVEVWAHPQSFARDADRRAVELAASGVTRVRLAASYHGGRWLLTTSAPGDVAYLPDSVPMFPTDPALYGEISPACAPGGVGATAFLTAASALRRAGIEVTAWVAVLHNSALATAHPRWAVRNVLGRPYRHALCPASYEVARYAAALVRDCGSQGVAGVDVEALGFLGWAHAGHHEKVGVQLRPVDVYLLSLCVCAACREVLGAHGADVDLVSHRAAEEVRSHLAGSGRTTDPAGHDVGEAAARVLGPTEHAAVQAARASIVQDVVHRVAAAAPVSMDLRVSSRDHDFTGKASGDLEGLAKLVDAVTVTDLTNDLAAVDRDLAALDGVAPRAATTVGLSAFDQHEHDPSAVTDFVAFWLSRGIRAVAWYAYDLAASQRLSMLAQLAADRPRDRRGRRS